MNDGFIDIILCPCPWCRKTPELYMPLSNILNTGGTWRWDIECRNQECPIRPESKKVNIRGKQKNSLRAILEKLYMLASKWNDKNPLAPYEKKRISVKEFIEKRDKEMNYEEISNANNSKPSS